MRRCQGVFAAIACLGPVAAQQNSVPTVGYPFTEALVAPVGFAGTEGNASNYWPWWLYTPWSYFHFQEIYDSTIFTSQGIAGPVRISQLRYRADGSNATWAGGMWPNVRIDMSTAAVDYLAPSLDFAQNHGPDRTTVVGGPVQVQPGSGGSPGPWYVAIPLAPFVYDPTSGSDLLVDIEIQGILVGTSFFVDHVSGTGALGTRLMTASSGSPVATSISFDYTPVTEFTCERAATYQRFAPGCAGSAGVPSNQATALPQLGRTMVAVVGNLPAPEIAVLCLGWSNTTSPFGPLPLDLAPRGAPGCLLRVAVDSPIAALGSAGSATFGVAVPSDLAYLGVRFYAQAFVFDAAANALGATVSDAAVGNFGH